MIIYCSTKFSGKYIQEVSMCEWVSVSVVWSNIRFVEGVQKDDSYEWCVGRLCLLKESVNEEWFEGDTFIRSTPTPPPSSLHRSVFETQLPLSSTVVYTTDGAFVWYWCFDKPKNLFVRQIGKCCSFSPYARSFCTLMLLVHTQLRDGMFNWLYNLASHCPTPPPQPPRPPIAGDGSHWCRRTGTGGPTTHTQRRQAVILCN